MEEQPQSAKRKRRPSVRLGEIGYSGPYDASSMWTEVPRQRKKPQPGVKPPRIRPLEHLAAETAVIEEEWGVIEPIQHPEPEEQNDDDSAPVIKEQQIKRRKPRTTTKQPQPEAPPSPSPEDDEKDYEEAPLEEAPSSSDSEEDLPPSDDSEQANPNSHEMQGAIEDGPNRRSRVPRVSNKSLIRDDIELTIKDPVPLAVPNGTPNSSSQREMLSAGVSGWLEDLGLGKYSELFELNEVDTEVLPLLTFDDLREMGVEAVGARRKMFHGIQELGQIRGI